jgi:hypothetical protein
MSMCSAEQCWFCAVCKLCVLAAAQINADSVGAGRFLCTAPARMASIRAAPKVPSSK